MELSSCLAAPRRHLRPHLPRPYETPHERAAAAPNRRTAGGKTMKSGANLLEQEPLPELRDVGEPLIDMPNAAKRLGMGEDAARALAEGGKLLAYGRNAHAKAGQEKRTRWATTARAIRLYEAKTANFKGLDAAQLLLDIAKRMSPALRLWLRNEISRTIEGGQ